MPFYDQTEENEADSEELGTSEENSESNPLDASDEEGTSEESNSSSEEDNSQEESWLIPGRIKTKEDLLNAYHNLETAFGQRSNELHELRRLSQAPQVSPEQELARFAYKIKQNPIEAIRDVVRPETEAARREARQVRFESEYYKRRTNPEFVKYEARMNQIAQENSDVVTKFSDDPRVFDWLFYMAKGLEQGKDVSQAEARGKRKGESAAIRKVKAQVEGSSGSKGHSKKNFEELSLKDMEKELRRGNLE